MANSQARVGSEKNAKGGATRVSTSDVASEVVATSARTTRYGRSEDVEWAAVRRRVCRMNQAVPMMMAGHTR